MRNLLRWNVAVPFFLFLASLVIYTHNLSPSVYGGDVGDFLSAISVMGVPHPPGYPLMTVLGILFAWAVPNVSLPYRVGLISAVASSITLVFVYLTVRRLTKSYVLSLFSALFLAFSYIFFLYAEVAEVFALNTLFAALLFFLSICYYQTKQKKYLYWLAITAGLALTNQQTILLLFPSILILLWHRKFFSEWRRIWISISLFILGFSIYAYVPLAASHHPPINWDDASNLPNFLRLLLRMDFGTFSSGANGLSFHAPLPQRLFTLSQYDLLMRIYATPAGIILAILGGIFLFFRERRLFVSFFLAFLLSGPIFIAYSGFPLNSDFNIGAVERFFLLSILIVALLAPFGIQLLTNFFTHVLRDIAEKKRIRLYTHAFQILFFLVPVLLLIYNFPKTDLSHVLIGDTFAEDLLAPLPSQSILILSGDTPVLNVAYLQYSRHVRQDVIAVNILAPEMSTAYLRLERQIPAGRHLPAGISFSKVLYFSKTHPVFSLVPLKKGKWVPYGLVYRFVPSGEKESETLYVSRLNGLWGSYHVPYASRTSASAYHNLTIAQIPSYYSVGATNEGYFLVSEYGDIDRALRRFQTAVAIDPADESGYKGLGYVYLSKRECGKAADMLQKAISLDPSDKSAVVFLYSTYRRCYNNPQKANAVAEEFKSLYGRDIQKEIKYLIQAK